MGAVHMWGLKRVVALCVARSILSALKMQLSRAPQVHYFEEESEDCCGGGGGGGKAVSSVGAASASPLPVLLNPKPVCASVCVCLPVSLPVSLPAGRPRSLALCSSLNPNP
jgi:hypothetical protein